MSRKQNIDISNANPRGPAKRAKIENVINCQFLKKVQPEPIMGLQAEIELTTKETEVIEFMIQVMNLI